MSLEILTHESDESGLLCRHCGSVLVSIGQARWKPFRKVGLIVTRYVPRMSYPIGEHDTNRPCR